MPGPQQRSKLTNTEALKEVNIVVEMAAQELHAPSMEIQADNLPFEALSDLESDPEDISIADQSKYQKNAHIDKVASVKWMSHWKIWTSEAVIHYCSDMLSDEELTHYHLVV